MMQVHIITPFVQMVESIIGESIIGRAASKEIVQYSLHNLFDFADPPHYKIDDYPFGGGTGMIMKPEPLFRACDTALKDCKPNEKCHIIFPTPDGKLLDHETALELSKAQRLIFINGHYKGVDQRVRDRYVTDEISIGDYVLTGGELPAMVILDSTIRLIPGVLNSIESAETDSFTSYLLDFPHYTRPEEYEEIKVPEILKSGHHKKIKEWRGLEQRKKTQERRPDIWKKYIESKELR